MASIYPRATERSGIPLLRTRLRVVSAGETSQTAYSTIAALAALTQKTAAKGNLRV